MEACFGTSLAHGNGDWVILPTSINHGFAMSELSQREAAHLFSSQQDASQQQEIRETTFHFHSQNVKYSFQTTTRLVAKDYPSYR